MLTTCKYFDVVGNRCSRVTDGKCDDLPNCEFKYIEELKAENEKLRNELATYGATGVCEVCSDKANKLADKYLGCLQEIKKIADAMYEDYSKRWDDNISEGLEQIIDLITKTEEE